jgi:hypothetical protein
MQSNTLVQSGRSEEGGPKANSPNLLAVADEMTGELQHARKPILISDSPFQYLLDWRMGEIGQVRRLPTPPMELLTGTNQDRLDNWLQAADFDLLLVIDVPQEPAFFPLLDLNMSQFRGHLNDATGIRLIAEKRFPNSGVTTQLWRRTAPLNYQKSQVVSALPPEVANLP